MDCLGSPTTKMEWSGTGVSPSFRNTVRKISHCSWFVSWNSSMMAYVYCARSRSLSELPGSMIALWTERIMSLKDCSLLSDLRFCHSSKISGVWAIRNVWSLMVFTFEPADFSKSFTLLKYSKLGLVSSEKSLLAWNNEPLNRSLLGTQDSRVSINGIAFFTESAASLMLCKFSFSP